MPSLVLDSGGVSVLAERPLRLCDIRTDLPLVLARRGSAVDAIVVAFAEPGGTVLTSDLPDLAALAGRADRVHVFSC